jgi:hypothetical protein
VSILPGGIAIEFRDAPIESLMLRAGDEGQEALMAEVSGLQELLLKVSLQTESFSSRDQLKVNADSVGGPIDLNDVYCPSQVLTP